MSDPASDAPSAQEEPNPPSGREEPSQPSELKEKVIEALKTCFDPEIPVNIYDLGLVYDVRIEEGGVARIEMTLTSPACPVAGQLVEEVRIKTEAVAGVERADVDLVWDPPWHQGLLSEAARLQLGLM